MLASDRRSTIYFLDLWKLLHECIDTHILDLFSFFVITYNFHGGNNEIYAENLFGLDEYYWKWGT